MLKATLADHVRVLGADHPTTSIVRGNLKLAQSLLEQDQGPSQT